MPSRRRKARCCEYVLVRLYEHDLEHGNRGYVNVVALAEELREPVPPTAHDNMESAVVRYWDESRIRRSELAETYPGRAAADTQTRTDRRAVSASSVTP
jgi:hypothetical protein